MSRTAVVAIVVFAAVSLLSHNSSGVPGVATSTAPLRHYYLTKTGFNGNQALTACATGYHFASFSEISDPSVITYNQTLGFSNADDGSGPPMPSQNGGYGWIRTGYVANTDPSNSVDPTNCSVWTSANSTDYGEVLFFDAQVGSPSNGNTSIAAFRAFNNKLACNSGSLPVGVWCVQN